MQSASSLSRLTPKMQANLSEYIEAVKAQKASGKIEEDAACCFELTRAPGKVFAMRMRTDRRFEFLVSLKCLTFTLPGKTQIRFVSWKSWGSSGGSDLT